ncbi:MAG: glycosyltransferase family A protein [Terrisporobacter sp.]|uniref:glycosyltransferase family 2 protein n=1 Tax=Terrisporobacter TaxID=1505652 RepID=UPI002903FD0F|nr:glycosyltransferase family A protein [Terrisporobacter othiniensis]MDU2200092.1 glycosyltransferase family A protein [Terrisporobacter othiniensis]
MATLTVFTPTYNRAYILQRCYESLVRQTSKDFIWLIIDDGSTDNTKSLVDQWIKEKNEFEIKYVYKENGGMHTGHNKAYELIDTELNVCIDSDDFMPDNSVELIVDFWSKYGSNRYSGIVSLDNDDKGNIIGTKLPNKKSIKLCDFYDMGGKGDKNLIYRTDIMKKYPPYPEFQGEKFVPLDYKYLLADQEYDLLILNEPTCTVEYMEDGSSRNMFRQYYKNPRGFSFMRKVHMIYDKKFINKFKSCIHYVSGSLIIKNRKFLVESPKKFMTLLAYPFGCILYLIILRKNRQGEI